MNIRDNADDEEATDERLAPGIVPAFVRQRVLHLGQRGERWLAELPEVIAQLERAWSITVGQALAVPATFLAVNLLQAYIVTPLLQGHRLTLNPVAIFVGLTFFWFIWGVPGAFLAVPLLATFKIVCDHVASLAAVGEFLGERDEHERRRLLRED